MTPTGTSFWSASLDRPVFRFNIQTGKVEVGPIDTGAGFFSVFGLCVKGELTSGTTPPPTPAGGFIAGGGRAFTSTGVRVTHGFELQCNITDVPNNLEVNWGSNQFKLTTLTSASCLQATVPAPLTAPGPTALQTGWARRKERHD